MANKRSPNDSSSIPEDFPETTPDELFPTNNIRFVMWETAKLTERVEGLTKAIDKLGPAFEKALDKHAADMKERIAEVKMQGKETSDKLGTAKSSIDSFKGAIKVFGGIYALALVIMGAFLAWFLRPVQPAPVAPLAVVAPPTAIAQPPQSH